MGCDGGRQRRRSSRSARVTEAQRAGPVRGRRRQRRRGVADLGRRRRARRLSRDGDAVSLGADRRLRAALPGDRADRRRRSSTGSSTARASASHPRRRPTGMALESLRDVSAWFERDEGVAALAVRPRKASGHADDESSARGDRRRRPAHGRRPAAVDDVRRRRDADADEPRAVDRPREESEQYPRRIAGEATGPGRARGASTGSSSSRAPLRCHSRGRDGAGVYLLARRA